MFYNQVAENGNTRETVNQWNGYNHNYNLSDGQFFEMRNLSSDCFPYITQRSKRNTVKYIPEDARALIRSAEGFAYLEGLYLHYNINGEEQTIDLSEYFFEVYEDGSSGFDRTSKQTMTKMGALIIMFPKAIQINTATGEVSRLGMKDTIGGEYNEDDEYNDCIGYIHVDADGNEIVPGEGYQIADSAPTERPSGDKLQEGDYWYNTKTKQLMVYDADSQTYMPVTTTYIKIGWYLMHEDEDGKAVYEPRMYRLKELFKVGDAVYMDSRIEDINNGSIIQAMDDYSITVIGTIPGGRSMYAIGAYLTIERRIPPLDHVCVSANRLWACHYGLNDENKMVNEIMCCKQGDPTNWYVFDALATDAYSVSIGDDGPFTGAIEFQGMPTFFKENMIYRIYGNVPANYQLITINARGVQKGSEKSLAICNEYLIYKSPQDVVIFDGNKPTGISMPLGRDELLYNGIAGWCMGKYYIRLDRKILTDWGVYFEPSLYVYDMDYNVWYREDEIDVKEFLYNGDGKMYGYISDGSILGFGPQDPEEQVEAEDDVEFWAETGDMGYEYPDHKYIDRLSVRAFVDIDSHLDILISYDGKDWEMVGCMEGSEDAKTNTFAFAPVRCDHFRLRFEGSGNVRVYTLSRTIDTGSEEHPWTR